MNVERRMFRSEQKLCILADLSVSWADFRQITEILKKIVV